MDNCVFLCRPQGQQWRGQQHTFVCNFQAHRGITAFIIEASNPGIIVGKKEDKLGIRASSTCEVILENCEVSADCVLGNVGEGYKIAIGLLRRYELAY